MPDLPEWMRSLVDRGLLSPEQARAVAGAPSASAPPPPESSPSSPSNLVSCAACSAVFTLSGSSTGTPLCPTCGGPLRPVKLGGVIVGSQSDSRGSSTIGRYKLIRELGRGGMGVVWLAEDPLLHRNVALKLLSTPQLDLEPGTTQRFLREAGAAARLPHPGIVAVHDVGLADGRHFFTMDFVDGPNLETLLSSPERRAWPRERLVEMMAQVAAALGYAHSRGIVHRDVKPGNILVGPDGRPRLSDFGLARDLEAAPAAESLTAAGAIVGTPHYMSPEQASRSGRTAGPPSDVFSFGIVLYRILAGRLPFPGAGFESLVAILSSDPEPPSRLDPSVPASLEAVCLRCLQKDPAHRYLDGAALAADLERFLAGLPVEAPALRTGAADADPARSLSEALSLLERARPALQAAERSLDDMSASVEELFRTVEGVQAILSAARDKAPGLALTPYLAGSAWDLLGHEERAEECWREAVRLDPDFAPAHYRLGRLLAMRAWLGHITARVEHRDLDREARLVAAEAERELETAMTRGSGFDDALHRRVAGIIATWTRDDLEEAKRLSREGLLVFPAAKGREELHFVLGMMCEGDERLGHLDEVIRLKPRHAWARFARGSMFGKKGLHAEARADLDEAIRVRPRFSQAFVNRGHIRYSLRDLAGAMEDYNCALAFRPQSPIVLNNRAILKRELGDIEGARADYDEAIRIAPAFTQPRLNRAIDLLRQGNPREALADLDAVIAAGMETPEAYFNRTRALAALGDLSEALKAADEAVRRFQKNDRVWYERGLLRGAKGDTSNALADFDEAVRLKPGEEDNWRARGLLRLRLSDGAGAVEDLRRAAGIAPHRKEIAADLARAEAEEQARPGSGSIGTLPPRKSGSP